MYRESQKIFIMHGCGVNVVLKYDEFWSMNFDAHIIVVADVKHIYSLNKYFINNFFYSCTICGMKSARMFLLIIYMTQQTWANYIFLRIN